MAETPPVKKRRPLAGNLTFALFAAGIIGTRLLAVPVLAGVTAYAVTGAFGQRGGPQNTLSEARLFYVVLIVASIAGIALNPTALDPIKALCGSAVIIGVGASTANRRDDADGLVVARHG